MFSVENLLQGTGVTLQGGNDEGLDFHEHSIIIMFLYGLNTLDPLHQLDEKLFSVFKQSKLGVYDGHEIADDYSHGFLYLYGANAMEVFRIIRPILQDTSFMDGAKATLRFGPPEKNPPYMALPV